MERLKRFVQSEDYIEIIEIVSKIAKVFSLLSTLAIVFIMAVTVYTFSTTQKLILDFEWGGILFLFCWGFFIYITFSFAFRAKLMVAFHGSLWVAVFTIINFLWRLLSYYQDRTYCLITSIVVLSLSVFIFRHKNKAIERIRNQ